MISNKKEQICELLKGIETGDPSSVSVVNEEKYIQHNPQTLEGSEGLAELFKRLSKTLPRGKAGRRDAADTTIRALLNSNGRVGPEKWQSD